VAALLTTLSLLTASWVAHLVWWRLHRPERQSLGILLVFVVMPVVAALVLRDSPVFRSGDLPGMALLYIAATACYLITYAGVEERSPSLVLVRALQLAGAAGCTRDELAQVITDDAFVAPRLHALKRDGLIAPAVGGFALTPRGRRVAQVAVMLASVFGVRTGG